MKKYKIFMQALSVLMLAQLATDIYLPSIPKMSSDMGTTTFTLKFSATLMVIALGFSQIYYGPLSDYKGRRYAIIQGLLIFSLGSLLTLFFDYIHIFLLGRVLQGLGLGFGLSLASVVAVDIYNPKKQYQALSIISIVYAMMPVLAPVIGGHIQLYFGWHINLLVLAILGIVLALFFYFFFPETNNAIATDSRPWQSTLVAYIECLKNKLFLINVLIATLFYSGEISYIIQLPLIAQYKFNIPFEVTGYLVAFTSISIVLGSSLSTYLLRHFLPNSIVFIGNSCSLIAALTIIISIALFKYSIYYLILPMSLYMFGSGLSFPNAIGNCLGLFPNNTGLASSLAIGALTMLGGLLSYIVAKISVDNIYGLPILILIISICLVFCSFLIKKIDR